METVAKEAKLAKLLRKQKSKLKKFTGSRISVTRSLLCFGCFAARQHVTRCFFANINVFFLLTCIGHCNIYNRLIIACIVKTTAEV